MRVPLSLSLPTLLLIFASLGGGAPVSVEKRCVQVNSFGLCVREVACAPGGCGLIVRSKPARFFRARQDDGDEDGGDEDDAGDGEDNSGDVGSGDNSDLDGEDDGTGDGDTSDDDGTGDVDDPNGDDTNTDDGTGDIDDPNDTSGDNEDDTGDNTDNTDDDNSDQENNDDGSSTDPSSTNSTDTSAASDDSSTDSSDSSSTNSTDTSGASDDSSTDSSDSSSTNSTDTSGTGNDGSSSTNSTATNSGSGKSASGSSGNNNSKSNGSGNSGSGNTGSANTNTGSGSTGSTGSCGTSVNSATVSLIKKFEGFVASPAPDPIGLPTVGFGHKCVQKNCAEVPFPFPLNQDTASSLLQSDLKPAIACVNKFISNSVTLNDNQVGALSSFAFNVGCGNLQTSTLVKRLNNGEDPNTVAAQELPRFNKAGGKVLSGLTSRRAAEVQLFQTPSGVVAHPCT